MSADNAERQTVGGPKKVTLAGPAGARWDPAFVGILAYVFVEYTRLALMYPALQDFQLGKVIIGITVIAFLLFRHRAGAGSGARSIDIAFLLFLAAGFLSVLFSSYPEMAWRGFIDFVAAAFVYFLISRIVTNSWRLRVFVFLLLLLNLKMSQFQIRDYLAQRAFGRSDKFLSIQGVGAGSTDIFGNPGDFGVAMCVVWGLASALLIGERKKIFRFFLLICSGSFLASILLCGSRGAVVAAGVITLVALGRQRAKLAGLAMVLLLVVGLVLVLPGAMKEKMQSALDWQEDETASMRVTIWTVGLQMFRDHPLFGVGIGRNTFLQSYYDNYRDPEHLPYVLSPHSIYMQALTGVGLVGALPLLFLWLCLFRLNARTRRHLAGLGLADRRSFEYRLAEGLDLALVGFLVSGAFLTVLYYPHLWFLMGLSVGLHTACTRTQPAEAQAVLPKPRKALALIPS